MTTEKDIAIETELAQEADKKSDSFIIEFWHFAATNKKWWLIPIGVVLLMVSFLILASGSGAGPFIYTLF